MPSRILDGAPDDISHYGMHVPAVPSSYNRVLISSIGLDLAQLADLPSAVLSEARRVAEVLNDQQERDKEQSRSSKISIRRKAFLRVCPFHLFITTLSKMILFIVLSSCEHSLGRLSTTPLYPTRSSLLICYVSKRI